MLPPIEAWALGNVDLDSQWHPIGTGLLAPDCSGVVYETDPGERLLAVQLHEASHGLTFARGVKDTGQNGRYHNARFLGLALDVDLEVAKRKLWGFNHTRLSDFVRKEHAQEIDGHRAAEMRYRCPPAVRLTPSKASRPLYVCACEPPRKLRMSPRTFKAAAIGCAACGCEFREACRPTCQVAVQAPELSPSDPLPLAGIRSGTPPQPEPSTRCRRRSSEPLRPPAVAPSPDSTWFRAHKDIVHVWSILMRPTTWANATRFV